MRTNIAKGHRERACYAFREAIELAETKLKEGLTTDDIQIAKVMIELAELHLLANETGKAEAEFTKAYEIFNRYSVGSSPVYTSYIVYLLKSLSGIHECQGRKNEANTELLEAEKWEEKLRMIGTVKTNI